MGVGGCGDGSTQGLAAQPGRAFALARTEKTPRGSVTLLRPFFSFTIMVRCLPLAFRYRIVTFVAVDVTRTTAQAPSSEPSGMTWLRAARRLAPWRSMRRE